MVVVVVEDVEGMRGARKVTDGVRVESPVRVRHDEECVCVCGCAARGGMPFGRTTRGRACKIAMRTANCAMVIGAGHRERGFRIRRARCADVSSIGARPRLQQAAAHGAWSHGMRETMRHWGDICMLKHCQRNLHPFCKTSIQRIRRHPSLQESAGPRERVLPPRFLCTSLSMVSRRPWARNALLPRCRRGDTSQNRGGRCRHARRLSRQGRGGRQPASARARCSRR